MIRLILDFLIPRFMIDEVALKPCDDGIHDFDIACSMADVEPGEVFPWMCRVRCFTWLGFGMFPEMIGKPEPFVNPHDERLLT